MGVPVERAGARGRRRRAPRASPCSACAAPASRRSGAKLAAGARAAVRRARPRSGKGGRREAGRGVRHVRPGRVPPLRAPRARARARRARARRDRHRRQPGHRPGDLRAAARALPLRLAQGRAPRSTWRASSPRATCARSKGRRSAALDEIRKLLADREPPLRARRRSRVDTSGKTVRQTPRRNCRKALRMISASKPSPTATTTGSSRSTAPLATLALDVAEDKGLVPGYKLKLNSYDLGVDIELADALNRIRFEHPEVKARRAHQRQEPHVLLGRQHLHARRLEPRVEGELLQVHQRDAQRHRGLERSTRGSSSSPR